MKKNCWEHKNCGRQPGGAKAKELGVGIVISTDTHLVSQFDYMSYGVSIARRGWLEKKDVLNTLKYEQLMKVLQRKRGKISL